MTYNKPKGKAPYPELCAVSEIDTQFLPMQKLLTNIFLNFNTILL